MFGVTATDPKGRKRRFTRDLDDRVTESADWKDDHWITTTYGYAAWGLLNKVIDAAGNRTDIHHDTLGRRVRLDDPDRGTSTWELNGWGEVVSSTDSLGDTTLYERDRLGRVVWQSHDQEGVTTFNYDGAPYAPGAQGAAGALTRAVSPEGVATQFYYDQFGRPSRTSWRIDEEEFSLDREYDSLGRLETLRYPEAPDRDRFSVWYRYNAQGYLDKVSDVSDGIAALPLWAVTGRNAEGMLTGATMGNGVVEARGYDPVTGRIASIEALSGAQPLYSMAYHHDVAGDLESRIDHVTGREERFGYDALDRIRSWKVTHKGTARELTYGHDDLGNLESVTSPEGVELFHHDGQSIQNVLRLPHALTSRSTAGSAGQASSYWYDDKGRQVSGGGREIEWRSFDQPAAIYQGGSTTRFGYDAFGARVSKVHQGAGGAETTLTLGDLYERRTGADGGVEHLFTVHGPDGIVGQIVYRPDAPPAKRHDALYLQGDVQGSVGLVIDKHGHEVERRMFDPFGLVTDASGVPVSGGGGAGGAAGAQLGEVKLGFTGHRHDDEIGILYAKGRAYDPGQKRFLTADPTVPDPLFGQSLHRYSYCYNNPIRYSDPTGYDPQQAVQSGSVNGVEVGGLGGWIIGHRPGPAVPPSGDTGVAGGGGGGLGGIGLAAAAPGAAPDSGASPSPPSSTTETGNKPVHGPVADPPRAQSGDSGNTLMKARKMDPRVVRQTAAEQWFEALSRMDSNADRTLVIVGTAHVATQGVQKGAATFGLKVAGGAALNVTTLGAVATYTIWSEVHHVATSDDPLYGGADAVMEMFNPAYIVITRGARFYEAMQDFQFEEAGEALGEVEFVAGAVVAGSAPKIGGAAANVAPELPSWTKGEPTRGWLHTGKAPIELWSGASGGPAALPMPGRNNTNFFHVEAHAAQIMRMEGVSEATLNINRVPCAVGPGCANNLPHMLPEGARLRIIGPGGYDHTFVGLPDPPTYPR